MLYVNDWDVNILLFFIQLFTWLLYSFHIYMIVVQSDSNEIKIWTYMEQKKNIY